MALIFIFLNEGSHAALTCHIAIMQHIDSGVVSLGHFDNFCCWQRFGEESSAHKEGINTMLNEISNECILKYSRQIYGMNVQNS